MTRFEWVSFALQVLTLMAASYFAGVQNTVNDRLARLEDYVSVSAVPEGSGIRFLNTGGSNVYINAISVDGHEEVYTPPRQIAAKSEGASSYFVPISFETANKKEFDIILELIDEFGTPWISRHGGAAADEDPATGLFHVWTYKTHSVR